VTFTLKIFVLKLCIHYSPFSASSNTIDRSILPDFIIGVELFVQSHKLCNSNYVILTIFLLFPSAILTSLFLNLLFRYSFQEEKPNFYHMINTATEHWYMWAMNTVKDVQNLLKNSSVVLWFPECYLYYIVTDMFLPFLWPSSVW